MRILYPFIVALFLSTFALTFFNEKEGSRHFVLENQEADAAGKAATSNIKKSTGKENQQAQQGYFRFVTSAPIVSAVKTVDKSTAFPGDTLTYNITITNSGTDNAVGTALADTLDANTTYVANSLRTTPIATPDNYSSIGNVGISVPAANGVLANDYYGSPSGTLTTIANGATLKGGSITLNADGSFDYTPAAGFTGNDTAYYTLSNSLGSDVGTIAIAVNGMIWFIDNNYGGATADGRLSTPFKNTSNFQSINNGTGNNPKAGQNIFVYESAVAYIGNITLLSNQNLIGQDANAASLASIVGITVPTYSKTLPALASANATYATLTTTAASSDVVALNGGAASTNTVRGITIGNRTGNAISGTNFGTLNSSDITINGSGAALNLNTGAVNATFASLTSSSGAKPVSLALLSGSITINGGTISGSTDSSFIVRGGTLSLTSSGNITHTNTAPMVSISGGHTTGTITFNTGTLSATNGSGIQFNNADGNYNFNGTNTLNGGDAGIDVANGSSGTIAFSSSSNITNPTNEVIKIISSAAAFTYPGNFTKTNNAVSGIVLQNNTGNTVTFSGATKTLTTTSAAAVSLTNNAGTSIVFSNGNLVISTTSGNGFLATGGAASIVVSGAGNTISSTQTTALNISNSTIGAAGVTFKSISSGYTGSAGTPNGIILNNTGTLGGLTVTGVGTTAGSGGTIQYISGRGIEAISTSYLSLKNITLTQANLNNSGVSCDQNATSGCYAAIFLQAVTTATLSYISISNTAQQGIAGSDITNLAIDNCTVTNNGNEVEEGALKLRDLKGHDCSITNSTFTNSATRIGHIINTTGTMHLAITNCSFTTNDPTIGEDCFEMRTQGSAIDTIVIASSNFKGAKTKGVQIFAEQTSKINLGLQTSIVDRLTNPMAGIEVGSDQSATMKVYINGNTSIRSYKEVGLNVYSATTSNIEATIVNNTIETEPFGSFASLRGYSVNDATSKLLFKNNNITKTDDQGILVHTTGGNGTMDATLDGNTVTNSTGVVPLSGIEVRTGTSTTSTYNNVMCAYVKSNTVTANSAPNAFLVRNATNTTVIKLQGNGTTVPAVWSNNANVNNGGAIIPDATTTLPKAAPKAISSGNTCAVVTNTPPLRIIAPVSNIPADTTTAVPDHLNTNEIAAAEELPVREAQESSNNSDTIGQVASVVEQQLDNSNSETTVNRLAAADVVNVSGITIPVGKSVTVQFKAAVKKPFPQNVCSVSNQGTVSGSNFTSIRTDNDANAGNGISATTTTITVAPVITAGQSDITTNPDAGVCTATKSFGITAAGCPAPVTTYKLNGSTITSPYAFPVGTNTVTGTVSNGVSPDTTFTFTVTVNAVAPTISTQPSNITVCESSPASFTVSASGSNLTYQWMVDNGSGFENVTNVAPYSGATTSTLNISSPTAAMNGYKYKAVISSCAASPVTSNIVTLSVTATGSWTGVTSSDWNTASNWCGGVPTAASNVVIPASAPFMPQITTGSFAVNNITISAGGNLSLTGGTFTINGSVSGTGVIASTSAANIVIGGTLAGAGGSLLFDAASNSINSLTINRSGTAANVTIGSKLNLYGVLTLTAGTLNSNSMLVLKSTATSTSRVAPVTGGAITGNVTVERYINSLNNRAYRLITPSVNTTTTIRENWQENGSSAPLYGTHITGSNTGANGFDQTVSGQPSLYTYTAATPAWTPISNTNVNTLSTTTGYLLYVRGDRTINLAATSTPLPSTNTTLRATGTLLTGNQTFSGLTGNSGFSLVTNPYASPISWATVYAASTGVTQYYTYWDPKIGVRGGYVTVKTDGTKTPGTNAGVDIQQGQAFFVQASGATSPTVRVAETDKTTNSNLNVMRLGAQTEALGSSLYFTDEYGQRKMADGVLSVYNNNYTAALDGDDARQIANWDEDIAITRAGDFLSIESRPLIDNSDTIYFTASRLQPKNYEWQFEPTNFSQSNLQAWLIDNYLQTRTPISLNSNTIIPFTVTSNAQSSMANRFEVVFASAAALPVHMTTVKGYPKSSGAQIEWSVTNEINMDRYEVEKSTDGVAFNKLGSVTAKANNSLVNAYELFDANANTGNNYYRIKAISKTGEVQYSVVVKVTLAKGTSNLVVYPNPVKGNVLTVNVNLEKGKYVISLTNKLGQIINRKSIDHTGGMMTENLPLPANMAHGVYQLQLAGDDMKLIQQVIKQ